MLVVKKKESSQSEKSEHASNAASSSSVLPIRQQKVSSVLDEILTYPEPEQKKSLGNQIVHSYLSI